LQADELYARHGGQWRKVGQRDRAVACPRATGVVLPADPHLEILDAGQFGLPCIHQPRIGRQIGDLRGDRAQRRAKYPGQTGQGKLHVELRQWLVIATERIDGPITPEDCSERPAAADDHPPAALFHQPSIAEELKGVTQRPLDGEED